MYVHLLSLQLSPRGHPPAPDPPALRCEAQQDQTEAATSHGSAQKPLQVQHQVTGHVHSGMQEIGMQIM